MESIVGFVRVGSGVECKVFDIVSFGVVMIIIVVEIGLMMYGVFFF